MMKVGVYDVVLLFSTGCECQPGKRAEKCQCAECKCCCKSACGSKFVINKTLIIIISLCLIECRMGLIAYVMCNAGRYRGGRK